MTTSRQCRDLYLKLSLSFSSKATPTYLLHSYLSTFPSIPFFGEYGVLKLTFQNIEFKLSSTS